MVYPDRIVDFAFCPYPCYQYLADLADPEDWGPDNRILLNYIDFTYRRAAYLQERVDGEGRGKSFIVLDGDFACFNTGLFTPRFEAIYALFQPNNRPDAQPWFLKGFFKSSDLALSEVDVLPARVHYTDNPADLIYDFHLRVQLEGALLVSALGGRGGEEGLELAENEEERGNGGKVGGERVGLRGEERVEGGDAFEKEGTKKRS